MSATIRLGAAVRRGIADPRVAWRVLRRNKTRLLVRVVNGQPAGRRLFAGRVAATLSRIVPGAIAHGRPRATLRVLGRAWSGSGTAAATAEARRLAAAPSAGPRLVEQLARVCLELGDREACGAVLAAVPPDTLTFGGLVLAAETAWREGRYRLAVATADRALARRPGDSEATRIRDVARGQLVVLEPGWRPPTSVAHPAFVPVRGRILHLLTNSLPYRQAGYTLRAQQVARCQVDVGLDPRMATRAGFPRNEGVHRAPPTSVVDGVTYHRVLPDLDNRIPADRLVARNVAAAGPLVEALRPAVLHPATNHVNAQVALALRDRYRIPIVYEVRGFLEETWLARSGGAVADSDRYLASREVETACMGEADAIVTLSESMRRDIVGRGIDPDRVVVVPNAVDVTRFVRRPRNEALAARLGIGDEPVMGYISSFTSYEGIRYLVEAAGELRRRGRRIRCLLVGDGEDRPAIEAAVLDGGLDDGTVILTGRVPHDAILDYYGLIDVFVVPRTNDRVSQLVTPLKPYEAMATERAVVVSGVDALLEIVTEGETGRSFVAEDPISLADAVEPLLDDPAERARLGAAARAWVTEHRTWAANGQRYRELYERLGVA